jgi:hypothetical protein
MQFGDIFLEICDRANGWTFENNQLGGKLALVTPRPVAPIKPEGQRVSGKGKLARSSGI